MSGWAGILAVLAVASAPPSKPVPKPVAVEAPVEWTMQDGDRAYRFEGLDAVFSAEPCAPAGEECEEGDRNPVLTLSDARGRTLRLPVEMMQNTLIFGRLRAGDPPVALIQSYTGGAPCCTTLKVAIPGDDGWALVDLATRDGEATAFPGDVSGDGLADFVLQDDRFLYAFDSYAGSEAPPVILNVVAGKRVDVSADRAFEPLFRRHMQAMRPKCSAGTNRNAACAAYAADAARLGLFVIEWPFVLAHHDPARRTWPDGCTVTPPVDADCPAESVETYKDYDQALRAFLTQAGYLPPGKFW